MNDDGIAGSTATETRRRAVGVADGAGDAAAWGPDCVGNGALVAVAAVEAGTDVFDCAAVVTGDAVERDASSGAGVPETRGDVKRVPFGRAPSGPLQAATTDAIAPASEAMKDRRDTLRDMNTSL